MFLYILFSFIGIGLGGLSALKLNIGRKINVNTKIDIFIAAGIGLIIGAKIPIWISYGLTTKYLIYGKSYIGGILGAFIVINIYKYLRHKTHETFGDNFAIPLAIASGFGKIGCYFNGCCGGTIKIPVQLIESGFEFTMVVILYYMYKTNKLNRILFPFYVLSYLIMRFIVEFVRTEPIVLWGLTIYQIMSLIFTPIFVLLIIKRKSYAN
jgi:phosphatidylglycerol---prolipoprotein diacylglyceryl transferase